MADATVAISAETIEDIEFDLIDLRDSASDTLMALERVRTEIAIAAGAPGYAWPSIVPADVAAAIADAEKCARDAQINALAITRSLKAAAQQAGVA